MRHLAEKRRQANYQFRPMQDRVILKLLRSAFCPVLDQAAYPQNPLSERLMSSSQSRECPVVIVVEEETTVRQATARHLQDAGFEVIEAGGSDDAMTVLEQRSDVQGLVTDAHVPGKLDGFELAGLVRKRWPAIAVVMMSGHSDPSAGPIPEGGEFVAKPYLFSRLVPVLNRLLGRSE
jgi:CheY-like chemotaxis protein